VIGHSARRRAILATVRGDPNAAERVHTLTNSTAFVVELPALVHPGLVRHAASAVLTLADESGRPSRLRP
jgi:hypothetical protein